MIIFLGTYIGSITGILVIGDLLDKWISANPEFKKNLSTTLKKRTKGSIGDYLSSLNNAFIKLFDTLYGSDGKRLGENLWVGLFLAGAILVVVRGGMLLTGNPGPDAEVFLLWALVVAIGGASARAFYCRRDKSRPIKHKWDQGDRVGATISISGIIITAGIFSLIQLEGFMLWAAGIFMASFTGIVMYRISFKFIPIHPLKAIVSSLLFSTFLLLMMPAARYSLFLSIQNEGLLVLGFFAINIFADCVSILETRWILRRASNAGAAVLVAFLALDLILTVIIFLILPTVLGEIEIIWKSITFRGRYPWLGVLFWTTFSTSFLFYLFIIAALLVRLQVSIFNVQRILWRPFDVDIHPVRCIAVTIAALATILFTIVAISNLL